MNKTEVLALLNGHQNERGIHHWKRLDPTSGTLKSFGIGLTQLRKLAKQIGRDHALAAALWNSEYYDAKVIALLIDDPNTITQAQAEKQVEELEGGMLSHVFSSCDATLAKTPFAFELACKWVKSKDPVRRCCGYGLIYEESKSKKKETPTNAVFLEHIHRIGTTFKGEKLSVQGSMGGALMGIGKRNATLNAAALKVARVIGPIRFETESDNCEPLDVVKHLTSDALRKKLGV